MKNASQTGSILRSKKTVIAVIVLVLLVGMVVTAIYYGGQYPSQQPSATATSAPKILVIGTTLDAGSNLDPAQDLTTGIMMVNLNVFDTLYSIVPGIFPDEKVEPRLAAGEPTVSADGLRWTIPLRKGVVFQDGTPFNASAVKFSFDRVKQLSSYPAFYLELIAGTEVVDTYTVTLVLTHPYAGLKALLAGVPVAAIVSPSAVQNMGLEKFQELPVGSGPFKYVDWVKGDHITIAPFENYWNKSRIPKVTIIYKIIPQSSTLKLAFEKGDVDMAWDYLAVSDMQALLKEPGITHADVTENYHHLLTLNMGIPGSPLQDIRVRKAIAFAIDQDEISQRVYQGIYPAEHETLWWPGFYPKASWAQYNLNVTKAKQLLTEAGYPNGIDVTLYYTPTAFGIEESDLAVVVQQQLSRIGVRVHFQPTEETTFFKEFRAGHYEMALGLQSPDYPDADSQATYVASSYSTYAKRVHLNDSVIDQLVAKGATTLDPAQREQIYGEIQDRVADHAVYVPLVKIVNYWFYRADRVAGVPSYYLLAWVLWTLDIRQS